MLYYDPKSFEETLKLLDAQRREDLVILAGGTDVVPKLNTRPERSGYFDKQAVSMENKKIVYLGNAGLNYIKDQDGVIAIGAMTTMSEILDSPAAQRIPVLKEALSEMAGITIRNAATIGGNIMNASPAADSVPALIVLGAKAVLASIRGQREVPVEQLFTGPGSTNIRENEILKEVLVPVEEGSSSFMKFGRRKAESLSIVNGAAHAKMEAGICRKAVIAIGAAAPTPLRLTSVEQMLEGETISEALIEKAAQAAAEAVSPIDDKRASGAYRKQLVEVLVKRTLTKVCC